MTFVLNELVDGDKILASKLNENFEGLQGDITDNYTALSGNISTLNTTLGNVQDALADVASVPTGAVIWYGKSTAPTGFLICNGAAVSRSDYAALFAVIGTSFGSGDGSTTFNVPNLVGTYNHIQGSTTVGTQIAAGLPNITGKFAFSGTDAWASAEGCITKTQETGAGNYHHSSQSNCLVRFDLSATRSSSVYGNSSTVQPAATTLLPCIKY